ncbi:MAG TPA: hypothetical protein VFV75_15305 [Candidatus Polarisedimenticolaceae bacterium]|nr:hypothetical protein [Candidatus Polarisedimenticolaceae bacterium]
MPASFLLVLAVAAFAASDRNTVREREGRGKPAVPEDSVQELPPVGEIVVGGCQDSLDDCKKTLSECETRYPLPPGSTAAQINRVTRYEEGRACEVICFDGDGNPRVLSCVKPGQKSRPKLPDVPLRRGQIAAVFPVGVAEACPAGYMKLAHPPACVLSPRLWDEVDPETRSLAEREMEKRRYQRKDWEPSPPIDKL